MGVPPGYQPGWWTGVYCIDLSVAPKMACCYMGTGLYGITSSGMLSEYYYWHNRTAIGIY